MNLSPRKYRKESKINLHTIEDEDIESYHELKDTNDENMSKYKYTDNKSVIFSFVLICNCIITFIIDASYSICAPFLPQLSEKHGVDQSYLGIMFSTYSISMCIMSLLTGKFQYSLGRRNVAQWGIIISAIPFLGFYLINMIESTIGFILLFVLMRILQGIGASMFVTSANAILVSLFPNHVSLVIGADEMSGGAGLSIGPVIGTVLYKLGGINAPFLIFFVLCII